MGKRKLVSVLVVLLLVSLLVAADTPPDLPVWDDPDRPISAPADREPYDYGDEDLDAKWAVFPSGLSLGRDYFLVGQRVYFAFKNGTNEVIEVPGGAPWYIADGEGKPVFTPMSTMILIYLQPGRGLDWTWDQRDNDGNQVQPGTYQVVVTTSAGESRATFAISGTQMEKGQEVAPPDLPPDRPFRDIDGSVTWGDPHVLELYRRGIVNGRGNNEFQPDGTLTRAEFVTMLLRAYGVEPLGTDAEVPFTDVTAKHWAYGYIARAYQLGLVTAKDFNGEFGKTPEEIELDHTSRPYHAPFGPDTAITRLEMALIVGRVLGQGEGSTEENELPQVGEPVLTPGYEPPQEPPVDLPLPVDNGGTDGDQLPPLGFSDASEIPVAYDGFVRAASEYRVLRGYEDGSFGPDRYTTRREACVVVYRLVGE